MAITSTIDKTGPFLVSGLPQTTPVGFPFQQGSDLMVLDTGPTGSVYDPPHVLVLGSDYTVSGGGYNGANQMQTGSIVLVGTGSSGVLVNDYIVIMRNVPINQTESFTATGPATIALLEQGLDKQATLSQQLTENVGRALQFEDWEFLSGTLVNSQRAGMLLGFSSTGAIEYYTPNVVTLPGILNFGPGQGTVYGTGSIFNAGLASTGFLPFCLGIAAPGLVTLSASGSGSGLGTGTYYVGVVAVDVNGGEGNFDTAGSTLSNSQAITAGQYLNASWPAVPNAASYRVYVYGTGSPTPTYYQRSYTTATTSIQIGVQPAGPLQSITVTGSSTGGSLPAGDYYFAVSAVWSNGQTVDETNNPLSDVIYKHYVVTTNTGSVALSWSATDPYGNVMSGITGYNVYVISENTGSPRSHTKYFTVGPSTTSYTVLGTETMLSGPLALAVGSTDGGNSNMLVTAGIIQTSDTKNWFASDISINSFYDNDASFQANRYNIGGAFAGLDVRSADVSKWRVGLYNGDSTESFTLQDMVNSKQGFQMTPNTLAMLFGGSIATAKGAAAASAAWNLGGIRTSTGLAISTTTGLQVGIGGTLYTIALLSTNP